MSLPPVPVFDMSCRRLVEVDRHDARRLIAEPHAGAVHPVAGDVLPILWWALALDPGANMLTLRGPAVWFGAEPTWRRVLVIPPSSMTCAADRLRFEAKARRLLPPQRLAAWYAAVAEGWYRRHTMPQARHAVAAE
jgi:hypothetical protein